VIELSCAWRCCGYAFPPSIMRKRKQWVMNGDLRFVGFTLLGMIPRSFKPLMVILQEWFHFTLEELVFRKSLITDAYWPVGILPDDDDLGLLNRAALEAVEYGFESGPLGMQTELAVVIICFGIGASHW